MSPMSEYGDWDVMDVSMQIAGCGRVKEVLWSKVGASAQTGILRLELRGVSFVGESRHYHSGRCQWHQVSLQGLDRSGQCYFYPCFQTINEPVACVSRLLSSVWSTPYSCLVAKNRRHLERSFSFQPERSKHWLTPEKIQYLATSLTSCLQFGVTKSDIFPVITDINVLFWQQRP
jgi:hypothetical protein